MLYQVWVGKTPIDCDSLDAAIKLAEYIELVRAERETKKIKLEMQQDAEKVLPSIY